MPGEYLKGFPDPPNSPNEKFLLPSTPHLWQDDLYRDLINNGCPHDLALAISRSIAQHEDRKAILEQHEKKSLEWWANTHTHPGGSGNTGFAAFDPDLAIIIVGSHQGGGSAGVVQCLDGRGEPRWSSSRDFRMANTPYINDQGEMWAWMHDRGIDESVFAYFPAVHESSDYDILSTDLPDGSTSVTTWRPWTHYDETTGLLHFFQRGTSSIPLLWAAYDLATGDKTEIGSIRGSHVTGIAPLPGTTGAYVVTESRSSLSVSTLAYIDFSTGDVDELALSDSWTDHWGGVAYLGDFDNLVVATRQPDGTLNSYDVVANPGELTLEDDSFVSSNQAHPVGQPVTTQSWFVHGIGAVLYRRNSDFSLEWENNSLNGHMRQILLTPLGEKLILGRSNSVSLVDANTGVEDWAYSIGEEANTIGFGQLATLD